MCSLMIGRAFLIPWRVTRQGMKNARPIISEHSDPRGKAYYWIGEEYYSSTFEEGTDYFAVEHGYISVSPMRSDMTNHSALDGLKSWNEVGDEPALSEDEDKRLSRT